METDKCYILGRFSPSRNHLLNVYQYTTDPNPATDQPCGLSLYTHVLGDLIYFCGFKYQVNSKEIPN